MNSLVTTSQEETRVEEEPWKKYIWNTKKKSVCVHALLTTCINMQQYGHIQTGVAQSARVQ